MILRDWENQGFTLIELMCSMVIGSIILLLGVALLAASGDGYERISGHVASEREGRILVNQLTSDLSSAQFHKDFTSVRSTAVWTADRLGFLSLQPTQAQSDAGGIGDLCAVVYYIKDLTIAGKTMRCVMRGFRESSETFKALDEDDIPSLYQDHANIDEPIAIGVISFEACPKVQEATGKWIDWKQDPSVGPDAIDLRLVVARRSLSGKLKTSEDWDGKGTTGVLIGNPEAAARNENLEVYSTLIRFGSHENQ